MAPIISTFCCCFNLRTGCMIIGGALLIYDLALVIYVVAFGREVCNIYRIPNSKDYSLATFMLINEIESETCSDRFLIIACVAQIFQAIGAVTLFIGALKSILNLVLVFLIMYPISIVVHIVNASIVHFLLVAVSCLSVIPTLYYIITAVSLYQYLKNPPAVEVIRYGHGGGGYLQRDGGIVGAPSKRTASGEQQVTQEFAVVRHPVVFGNPKNVPTRSKSDIPTHSKSDVRTHSKTDVPTRRKSDVRTHSKSDVPKG